MANPQKSTPFLSWCGEVIANFLPGRGVDQHLESSKAATIASMENVYLGHDTAWWYWRNAKNAPKTLAAARKSDCLINCALSQRAVFDAVGDSTVLAGQRLFTLVDRKTVTNTKRVVFRHCPSVLPEGSFVHIAPGVRIASPELSFLQCAADNSLVDAMEYGFQLCGTFVPDPASKHGVSSRCSLTSVKEIAAFLDKCDGLRGISAARKALAYVIDGSASPRESAVSLLLTLPLRMGGYALPPFAVNRGLTVPKELRGLTRRASLRADFFWERARVAAEYDSDVAHLESEELCNDATKRIALQRMGYTTFGFTRLQVDDLRLMDESVAALRRELGVRAPQRFPSDYRKKQIELRQQLGLPTL